MEWWKVFTAIVFGLGLCCACNKKDPANPGTPSGNDTAGNGVNGDTARNVYVVGDTTFAYFVSPLQYWKNGVLTKLGDGYIGIAGGVSVIGNDVYIAADTVVPLGGIYFTTIWKNGTRIMRYAGSLSASVVSGTDIYTTGTTFNAAGSSNIATYWKNGNAVYMGEGAGSSIALSGSDVCVAGLYRNAIVYWKNGSLVNQPNNTISYGTVSIAAAGSDVYVASTTATSIGLPVATYWKNGVPTYLTSGYYNTVASAVTVSGTDLYVAGYVGGLLNPVATYWKNGVAVTLGSGRCNFITVFGKDVYVCGTSNNNAVYWKNGVMVTLGKGEARVMALQK